jgi:Kef-type K+ transport system membrane component KefB
VAEAAVTSPRFALAEAAAAHAPGLAARASSALPAPADGSAGGVPEGLPALALLLPAAALLGIALRRLGLPPLLAYLGTGLLLGPGLGWVETSHAVELLGELGIALLLFVVGLELSLDRLRDVGGVALKAGVTQVSLTAGLGWGLGSLLGLPTSEQAILALALAFSSTVVSVRLLGESGALGRRYGRVAVGVLLVQDMVVILVLTILAGIAGGDAGAGTAGEAASAVGADPAALLLGVGRAFGGTAILVIVALAASRTVLPRLFTWGQRSLELLFVWSLAWCLSAILAAEALGLSVELGAFLAGVSLAQLPHGPELERRTAPLAAVFLAVFFVTLGLRMEPAAALARPGALAALLVFATPLKFVILAVLFRRLGDRSAVLGALSLSQISEFSLILAALAASAGLAGPTLVSLLGVTALVSMSVSAILFPRGEAVARLLRRTGACRLLRLPEEPPPEEDEAEADPVVVVGMNALGRRLVTRLHELGIPTVAVDTDADKLAGLPGRRVIGDAGHPEVLHHAGAHRARLLVSALHIQEANLLLVEQARELGVPVSVNAFSPEMAEELEGLGCAHLMVSKNEGTLRFARALTRSGVLP